MKLYYNQATDKIIDMDLLKFPICKLLFSLVVVLWVDTFLICIEDALIILSQWVSF